MKIHIIAALLASGLLHGFAASADSLPVAAVALLSAAPTQDSPLAVALTVRKIVLLHGKEQKTDAINAEPGDILEYRAEYKNTGTTALTKILATLPLPEHTSFIAGSARPAHMTVSTRAAKDVFTAPPVMQKVASGSAATAASADADTYGALRWAIEKLMPRQTIAVSARVRIDSLTPSNIPQSAPVVQVPDEQKSMR